MVITFRQLYKGFYILIPAQSSPWSLLAYMFLCIAEDCAKKRAFTSSCLTALASAIPAKQTVAAARQTNTLRLSNMVYLLILLVFHICFFPVFLSYRELGPDLWSPPFCRSRPWHSSAGNTRSLPSQRQTPEILHIAGIPRKSFGSTLPDLADRNDRQ